MNPATLGFESLLSGGTGGLNFAPSSTSGGDPVNSLGGFENISVGGSGFGGGTVLLLVGAAVIGAYILWGK